MKFKPITKKYIFDSSALTTDYPDYLQTPIADWIRNLLSEVSEWPPSAGFLNELDIAMREQFPRDSRHFIGFVFGNPDRTSNFLGICLQNYAREGYGHALENILAKGGSAYAVSFLPDISSPWNLGVCDLVQRVPSMTTESSQDALNAEPLLREAWQACYSRNPDYEKTVSKCTDVLEGILRDKYFPKDTKPNLPRFLKDLQADPTKLKFKGSSLISPLNRITDLAERFQQVRGQHTKGTGRPATKEEAEFVLHYTIFFWNIER